MNTTGSVSCWAAAARLGMAIACVVGCGDSDRESATTATLPQTMAAQTETEAIEGPFPLLDATLAPLLGTWSCQGEHFDSPVSSALPSVTVQLDVQPILQGAWYTTDGRVTSAADGTLVFAWHSVAGFDPISQRLIQREHGIGGTLSDGTSDGFIDDTLVWDASDGILFFRDTYRQTEDGMTFDVAVRTSTTDAFTPIVSATCL